MATIPYIYETYTAALGRLLSAARVTFERGGEWSSVDSLLEDIRLEQHMSSDPATLPANSRGFLGIFLIPLLTDIVEDRRVRFVSEDLTPNHHPSAGVLFLRAEATLANAFYLMDAPQDPERGRDSLHLMRALKSYVAAILRHTILFEKSTIVDDNIMLRRKSTIEHLAAMFLYYGGGSEDVSQSTTHDTALVFGVLQIANRILNTMNWSPSCSEQTLATIISCHNLVYFATCSISLNCYCQGDSAQAFREVNGISPQQVGAFYCQIDTDAPASHRIRGSLVSYMASLLLQGFSNTIRSYFMDANRGVYSPTVQWGRNFVLQMYTDSDFTPAEAALSTAMCWHVLFHGEDAKQVAAKAFEDDIVNCLGQWCLDPAFSESVVLTCTRIITILWIRHRDTPVVSDILFSEVALAHLNVKQSPRKAPCAVELWTHIYDSILYERGDKPAICHNCWCQDNKGGVTAQQCSRCKIVQYCSRECQISAWAKHKPKCIRNMGSS